MGPFSDDRVIRLLNSSFVPLLIPTDEFFQLKTRGVKERERLEEVYRQADAKQKSRGAVQIYVLDADGKLFDSRHVRDASRSEDLLRLLRFAVLELEAPSGKKLIQEKWTRSPPPAPSDAIVLRFGAAYRGHQRSQVMDWVVLREAQWKAFSPQGREVGESWSIPRSICERLLVNWYPLSQDWDVTHNVFQQCELQAKVLRADEREQSVAVRGRLHMQHNRYTDDGLESVVSEVVGTVTFRESQPPLFRLTSGQATYGHLPFDALLINETAAAPSAPPSRGK